MHMQKLSFDQHGVTIIELLLVMLLLSIFAGFAIPQMQKVATRQEFVSEVDAAIDDFKIAQSWARSSILDLDASQSVVSYQIKKTAQGYERVQHFGDGTNKVLFTANLSEKNITIEWQDDGEGFEFKVPSGRTAGLDGQPLLNESLVLVFEHTGLAETISVTIDPSGTISR